MELRKFYASSMQEAMAMVRAECGEEAVILDSRTIREPAVDGAPAVEHVEVWVQAPEIVLPPSPAAPLTEPPTPEAPAPSDELTTQVYDLREQLIAVHSQLDQLADDMGWMGGPLEAGGELAQCIAESLAGKMAYSGGIHPGEQQPHLVALVGPTGVGKTTMIAKLAWQFAVLQGLPVGVLTTDTLRVGAVDQITRYCRHLELPLEVAYTPEEIPAALERLAGCALVLMDTPGGSQRNADYLAEMHALLTAADPIEVHLVVNAGSSPAVMRDIMRRFADLQPDQLIFTKLDEAPLCLEIFPLVFNSGMALSYLGGGQQIDRELNIASADILYGFLTAR
ncbi:MAG: flagellar biosynthesis protein FlhF [Armatimonadota bacterium]